MPIITAISSATTNTKKLGLISATSFPHTSLTTMISSNESVKEGELLLFNHLLRGVVPRNQGDKREGRRCYYASALSLPASCNLEQQSSPLIGGGSALVDPLDTVGRGRGRFDQVVRFEVILAILILVATGFLTTLPPASVASP